MASLQELKTGFPTDWTIADLQAHLGGIPPERIRLYPPPGMATLQDAIAVDAREERLCELVDGTLVEKTMGWFESLLASIMIRRMSTFVLSHDLGKVLAPDGTLNILPNMVRIPDVSFIGWDRFPKEGLTREQPIPPLVPDLAVEVLSKSNTTAEMQRKLNDYFDAGVRLVWYVDPETRSARAFTAVDEVNQIAEDGVLDGGAVLPGFQLSLSELFAEADRQGPV